jgi:Tol biopolymer transport system component
MAPATAVGIELVSRTTLAGPMDGNGPVERIDALTPDGRYTLFSSSASNLVAGDTNRGADLFLHDGTDGSTERVSVGTGGIEARGSVGRIGAVSDDGRYVVFDSDARNLVAMPTHGRRQIYLRDRGAGTTTLLTRFSGGAAAMADSANPRLSADGRHVVFDSYAALDADDTNGQRDIYRLDRQNGEFVLISVSADGRIGNADSYEPQISADGSAIVFYTWASNLVAGDTNNYWDLLLRKPAAGTTQRVSRKADGSQLASYPQLPLSQALSGDGRYIVFNAYESLVADDTNGADDGYRYDSQNSTLERATVSAGGQIADYTAVSALSHDGQRVLMQTGAAGVIAGQPSGNSRVFQRDLVSGAITHVTFRAGAEQQGDDAYGGLMSGDGAVVVATTTNNGYVANDANNMPDVLRQDGRDSAPTRVSAPSAGVSLAAANHDSGNWNQGFAASADQRYVAFGSQASNLVVGDANGADDIFVRDRLLGTNERVSVSTAGGEGFCGSSSADISADGRYVVFHSCSPLVQATPSARMDVYRHDRLTHTTEAVSLTPQGAMPNSYSVYPSISDDGRYVAFGSCASDLVANDINPHCDVFVRDMQAGTTVLASRSHDGLGADQETYLAKISGDGSTVAFASRATNLVAGDTNAAGDVFAFERGTQTLTRVSVSSLGEQADDANYFRDLSRDGRQVLFTSFASNFGVPIPFSGLYVHDRDSGATELVSRASTSDALGGNLNTAAISGDGRRIAFTSDGGDAGFGSGLKLVLFERDRARLGLVLNLYHGPSGDLQLDGDGTHLLLASSDNRLVDDDGNNHFSDVFLLDRLSDYLFVDDFEPTH